MFRPNLLSRHGMPYPTPSWQAVGSVTAYRRHRHWCRACTQCVPNVKFEFFVAEYLHRSTNNHIFGTLFFIDFEFLRNRPSRLVHPAPTSFVSHALTDALMQPHKRSNAAHHSHSHNTLTLNILQNGPFQAAKWAVLQCEMGRFAVRFGPFRKPIHSDIKTNTEHLRSLIPPTSYQWELNREFSPVSFAPKSLAIRNICCKFAADIKTTRNG